MNNMQLIGHVGQTPKEKTTPTGKKVANFSVAVKKYGGGEEDTQWFQCEAWNGLAEKVLEHVSTGREIFIEGSLKLDAYIDKSGVPTPSPVISVSRFHLCGKKPAGAEEIEPKANGKKSK
jgi:single-strand DNA-binding protein